MIDRAIPVPSCSQDPWATEVEYTIVILLTPTSTSMCACGCKKFEYDGVGAAAMFLADMWHRSEEAEPGTVKIAFFVSKENNPPINRL